MKEFPKFWGGSEVKVSGCNVICIERNVSMWSTRRLKHNGKGFSPVNKLPQSIYPQEILDAVKE